MGENQRRDIRQTGDVAQKANERRSESKAIGYGKSTLEEGKGSRKERAVSFSSSAEPGHAEQQAHMQRVLPKIVLAGPG